MNIDLGVDAQDGLTKLGMFASSGILSDRSYLFLFEFFSQAWSPQGQEGPNLVHTWQIAYPRSSPVRVNFISRCRSRPSASGYLHARNCALWLKWRHGRQEKDIGTSMDGFTWTNRPVKLVCSYQLCHLYWHQETRLMGTRPFYQIPNEHQPILVELLTNPKRLGFLHPHSTLLVHTYTTVWLTCVLRAYLSI